MATAPSNHPELQKAVEAAQASFSRLSDAGFDGTEVFERCKTGQASIVDIIKEAQGSSEKRKSTARLEKFQKCSASLQGLSGVIEVAVQTKADFLCPIWAPIKFVLKVSEDHARASDQILLMLATISEAMGHAKLYEQLTPDADIDAALLRLFTDVVEYSISAAQHFGRRTVKRLTSLVLKPYKHEFSKMRDTIQDHTTELHRLIMEKEAIHASNAREEEKKLRCHKWTRPCAMAEVHQRQADARIPGTCIWIETDAVFEEWKTTQSSLVSERLLRVSGTHGCGKSVLASAVFQSLEAEGKLAKLFSFSSTDMDRQTAESLARYLIADCLQRAGKESIEAIHSLFSINRHPSTTQLWSLLHKLLEKDPDQRLYVLDGLDEASDPAQEIIDRMSKLLQQCTNSKCLFLGRPQAFENLPEVLAQGSRHIQMDQTCTGPDIEAFINAAIGKVPILADPQLRHEAFNTLRENSRGMFLWGKLIIDDLHSSYSKHDVTVKLHDLPHGLEKAYERAFLRHKSQLRDNEYCLLRNVLTFVISARRPLTVDELSWAHALQVKSTLDAKATPAQDFRICNPEKSILHVCGNFVSIIQGRVHLNHSSIKDFLIRDKAEWDRHPDGGLSYFRVDPLEASASLGEICFKYLDMEDRGFPMREPESLETTWMLHPFVEYASYNFAFHAMEPGFDLERYSDRFRAFCSSPRAVSWLDHLAFSWQEDGFDWSLLGMLQDLFTCRDEAFAQDIKTRLSNQLRLEIDYRTAHYGPDDERTGHIRLCMVVLQLDGDGTASVPALETISPATCPRQMSTDQIPKGVELLQSANIIKSKHQVMVVVGAISHLMKNPLDPLNMLYHLLLDKASILPVYALLAIGNAYRSLGKFEQALGIFKKILPRVAGSGSRSETLTYELMGDTYYKTHQYGEVITYLSLAIGAHEEFPLDNRNFLGNAYIRSGRIEEGLSSLNSILANDRKNYDETHLRILATQQLIADMLNLSGQDEKALALLSHIVYVAAGKSDLENHAVVRWATVYIGDELCRLDRYRESISWLEGKCMGAGYTDKSALSAYTHRYLGLSYYYLGLDTMEDGALTRAIQHLEQSYQTYAQTDGNNDVNTCVVLCEYTLALKEAERFEESLENARVLVKANSERCGEFHKETAKGLQLVAEALGCLGRWEEGLECWRNLLRIQEHHFQLDEEETTTIHTQIHRCLSELGRTEEACGFCQQTPKHLEDAEDDTALEETMDI